MTWRAIVEYDMMRAGVAIHVADTSPDMVQHPTGVDGNGDVTWTVKYGSEAIAIADRNDSILLRVNDDVARAILDALALHYGGAVDARTTRADLLAERARSDRLIGGLLYVAQGKAAP